MRVLAIDTSTDHGSVAVAVDGEVRAEVGASVRARHGETLLPLLAEALATAGVDKREIELVAVGIGPGSFTGTRVGVATAKGLALALDVPLVGVVTLEAMALAAPSSPPGVWLAPSVDAHKGEVFVALYERTEAGLVERLAPLHGPPAEAAARLRAAHDGPLLVFGSGVRRYPDELGLGPNREVLPERYDAPRAGVIANAAVAKLEREGPDDRASLEPLYVRPSDAALPAER